VDIASIAPRDGVAIWSSDYRERSDGCKVHIRSNGLDAVEPAFGIVEPVDADSSFSPFRLRRSQRYVRMMVKASRLWTNFSGSMRSEIRGRCLAVNARRRCPRERQLQKDWNVRQEILAFTFGMENRSVHRHE